MIAILGAGKMAHETLRYLREAGARDIVVLNRTAERAHRLAERLGGRHGTFAELAAELAAADLIVSTTGASEPVVNNSCDRTSWLTFRRYTRTKTKTKRSERPLRSLPTVAISPSRMRKAPDLQARAIVVSNQTATAAAWLAWLAALPLQGRFEILSARRNAAH